MKIQESAENYLETILMISLKKGHARSIDIANELGFSKPSVSIAMKNLRENGYIEMGDDGNLILLPKGEEIAKKMYERHLLITKCLESIGVPADIAENDACRIEHIISEETFNALKTHCLEHCN